MSNVPYTTGKGIFQIQTGLLYINTRNAVSQFDNSALNYGILGRYGLFEKFELRSAIAWRSETVSANGQEINFSGLAFLNAGIRFNVINGTGTTPSLGFEADVRFPDIGAPEFQIQELAPRLFLLFSTPLIGDISFTSNIGIVWPELGKDPFAAYTINFSTPISKKTSVFFEAFGNVFVEREGFNLDGGIGYIVNKNLQLDISSAVLEITGENFGWWLDAGVSWRVDLKGRK